MDLRALREAAIEATARALLDRLGIVPDEDSDEWEAEYPRQFAALKQRFAAGAPAPAASAAPAAPPVALPGLAGGTAEQQRWAATIRADRLQQITDRDTRAWLAANWIQAKSWIDTRELPAETFRSRARIWVEEGRRQQAVKAREVGADKRAEAAAAAALKARIAKAGITVDGLIELVDASARIEPLPPTAKLAAKLAEITIPRRQLRVYESADPLVLLVKEKTDRERLDYAIERDEGLVADLRLFSEAAAHGIGE
jgi:hypothetical protein